MKLQIVEKPRMFPLEMAELKFNAYGHRNIRATHSTTLEFTKDSYVTGKGDCIIGVRADFQLKQVKQLINHTNRLRITIKCNSLKEQITARINPLFCNDKEMVIRKSGFVCKRTFAINADRAAIDLSRGFVELLRNPQSKIEVTVKCEDS